MRAAAEGEVIGVGAGDVEAVGIGEARRVISRRRRVWRGGSTLSSVLRIISTNGALSPLNGCSIWKPLACGRSTEKRASPSTAAISPWRVSTQPKMREK